MLFSSVFRHAVFLLCLAVFAIVHSLAIPCTVLGAPIDADLLLAGGTIVDGTGQPGYVGNVSVRDDRIVAVGDFEIGDIGKRIDCTGLIVAPGFIDLHNHSDAPLDEAVDERKQTAASTRICASTTRAAMCYLTQGCTTLVTGNCGGGALDVAGYYEQISKTPPGVNVAHLIPQGAVRGRVIGQTRRAPSDREVDKMRKLVRRGMEEGAWGMTTGLQYVPSSYASLEEIAALARVVAEYGGIYASHIRDEGDQLLESVDEAIEIGRRSGAPVHISHFKASKRPNWGKVHAAAALIEKARSEGIRVTADQYPYTASSTSITAMLLPDEEREGGTAVLIQRLNAPAQLPRLRKIVADSLERRGKVMVAECPKYPQWVGKMIREIAAEENRESVDVALDILRSGNEAGVSFSMHEEDVRWVMTLPWVATASDGSAKINDGTRPHPRSFGTFPRRIGYYAIEEEVVPLETAIRSASGLPADILGLHERGYLRPDYYADVAVLDPNTYRDHATFQSPFEVSTGVRWLLVNGRLAIDDGAVSDPTAGRALRKGTK